VVVIFIGCVFSSELFKPGVVNCMRWRCIVQTGTIRLKRRIRCIPQRLDNVFNSRLLTLSCWILLTAPVSILTVYTLSYISAILVIQLHFCDAQDIFCKMQRTHIVGQIHCVSKIVLVYF